MLSRMKLIKEDNQKCETRIYNPSDSKYEINYCNLRFMIYQKKELINSDEQQYLSLMNRIMNDGLPVEGRNGLVKSSFGEKMVFNLDRFPLLTIVCFFEVDSNDCHFLSNVYCIPAFQYYID